MRDSLSEKLVNSFTSDCEICISNMSESKYKLRSCVKHGGKRVQFRALDPRPPSAPAGDNTPHNYQTHDFTEMKRLLEEPKKRKKVLEETSQLEQMRKKVEVPHLRNAVLEKSAVQDPQQDP